MHRFSLRRQSVEFAHALLELVERNENRVGQGDVLVLLRPANVEQQGALFRGTREARNELVRGDLSNRSHGSP